jgi:hypothetical protein
MEPGILQGDAVKSNAIISHRAFFYPSGGEDIFKTALEPAIASCIPSPAPVATTPQPGTSLTSARGRI